MDELLKRIPHTENEIFQGFWVGEFFEIPDFDKIKIMELCGVKGGER
jgi:hypothetical protein